MGRSDVVTAFLGQGACLSCAPSRQGTAPPSRCADVSLAIGAGELVCVVGPNGAGKSTLINVIAGLHRPASGVVAYDGRDMTPVAACRFCDEGVAIVPEGRRLFTTMTVRENLELGSLSRRARGRPGARRSNASRRCSRCSRSGSIARRERSRAASSRWWRSRAR